MLLYKIIPLLVLYMACRDNTIWCNSYTMDQIFQHMHHEHIHAVESGRQGPGNYDCVVVNTDPAAQGMLGLDVAHVCLFFSITFCHKFYPCALVDWFSWASDGPDEDTGMWIVCHDCWNRISWDVVPTWNQTFWQGIVSDHCTVKTCANDIILTVGW